MEKNIKRIFEITNEFLKIPSTVGYEKPFLDHLEKKAKKLKYNIQREKEYLVIKPKNKNTIPKLLFSTHIDRQGFITNKENKIEYASYYIKRTQKIPFKREELIVDETILKNEIEEKLKAKVFIDNAFFRIKSNTINNVKFFVLDGFESFEKLALRYIKEKITSYEPETKKKLNNFQLIRYDIDSQKHIATYDANKKPNKEDKVFMLNSKIETNENKFFAQIDNVISSAVLFYLLETTNFQNEIIFTTKEEIGQSYLCVTDYINNKKEKTHPKLIVLDTSPYENFNNKDTGFLTLRHGDERGGFDNNLVEEIKNILEKNKIPFDFKPSFLGRTELGQTSKKTNGKINGTTLQIPTTNYHTTYETTTIESLKNYLKSIEELNEINNHQK